MVSLQSMNSRGQSQPVYRAALTKRKISGMSPGTHLVKPRSRAWLFSNDAGQVMTYMDFIGYRGKQGADLVTCGRHECFFSTQRLECSCDAIYPCVYLNGFRFVLKAPSIYSIYRHGLTHA